MPQPLYSVLSVCRHRVNAVIDRDVLSRCASPAVLAFLPEMLMGLFQVCRKEEMLRAQRAAGCR